MLFPISCCINQHITQVLEHTSIRNYLNKSPLAAVNQHKTKNESDNVVYYQISVIISVNGESL